MTITDTLARQVVITATDTRISSLSYMDANRTQQMISLNLASNTYSPPSLPANAGYLTNTPTSFTDIFLQSVTINSGMPEQQVYSFSYDDRGELKKLSIHTWAVPPMTISRLID